MGGFGEMLRLGRVQPYGEEEKDRENDPSRSDQAFRATSEGVLSRCPRETEPIHVSGILYCIAKAYSIVKIMLRPA